MNYLLIENKGILDINALILMGGTTKRGDESKIGFFGSGNKYAIALLVKNKVPFKIFAGEEEIIITTTPVTFRDKTFEKILINDQETSLTTDMGPQWEIWQAVREFVSNALDEGGYNIVTKISHSESRNGYTRIYIPYTPEIEEVVSNWDKYFAFDRIDDILSSKGNNIYPVTKEDEKLLLYRKGIRCYSGWKKSLYQYDLVDFEINESRVIENISDASCKIIKFLSAEATEDIAFNILNNSSNSEYWEESFWWLGWAENLNPNWRTAIGNRIIIVSSVAGWFMEEQSKCAHFIVTETLAKLIKRNFPDVTVYGLRDNANVGVFRKTSGSPKAQYMLTKAQEFFNETGYQVNYPILIGEFDRDHQLGGIGVNEIHIASKVFDRGLKELVMTIIEENEHLKTNLKDCSREFQNHWIQLFLTEKEERFAFFL